MLDAVVRCTGANVTAIEHLHIDEAGSGLFDVDIQYLDGYRVVRFMGQWRYDAGPWIEPGGEWSP